MFKQSKFTDGELNFIQNLALKKLHRRRILEEYVAVSLIKKYLVFKKWPIQI